MGTTNPAPALAALLAALGTAFILTRLFGAPQSAAKYQSIDGLRGYLAIFVFFHHAAIWYFFLRTDQWAVPPSHLYTHFGQSSVAFFFMITAFLFTNKLLEGKAKPIAWDRLYVSRVLRLTPLYLFVVAIVFGVVIFLSQGQRQEPIPKIAKEVIQWLTFTVLGGPNINGLPHTASIVAGVTWSLPYEWFFYGLLPIFYMAVCPPPQKGYLAVSALAIGALTLWHPSFYNLLSFAGGMAACWLVRSGGFVRFAVTPWASLLALACIATTIFVYPGAYALMPILLLSLAFAIFAAGNSLFGALTNALSRTLGEMAYSIYMLHGLLLFFTFHLVMGKQNAKLMSAPEHWLYVIGLTPLLIVLCHLSYRHIERPFMNQTDNLTDWLRLKRRTP